MAKRGRDGYPKAGDKPKKRGPGRPRQQELIEDRAIAPLERCAEQYADIRDQRMALSQDESKLKTELLALMKKHGKEKYHRAGVDIEIVHESETVKVRVKKPGEEGEGDEPGDGVSEFDDPNAGEQARP